MAVLLRTHDTLIMFYSGSPLSHTNMGRTVTNVDRTCGPTHLLVLSGNKICLN